MKTMNHRGWVTLVSLLILAPSMAAGEPDQADGDAGLVAFNAGDFAKALDIWQTDARLGKPKSQFLLGYLYETGQGVDVDYGQALFWYRESANNECRIAECNLAGMYTHGRGATVDHDEAIRRLGRCVRPGQICTDQRARMFEYVEENLTRYSDQGYADAQYELASLAQGRGAFDEAAALVQKAAQQGHGPAQVALADSYLSGAGIEQDVERGARLLFQAMVQHSDNAAVLRSAKSTLASAYYAGHIQTTQPAVSAYVWARLVLTDYPDTDSLPGLMYDMMAAEAKEAMTDGELGTAYYLSSRWTELFAEGLPDVTEEHLQTLRVPQ